MQMIYQNCPHPADERWLLRPVEAEDAAALLKVYGDRNALPFFNSDNCHGDNFYYNTPEKMKGAMAFWQEAWAKEWFARLTIVDKAAEEAVGTVELCVRRSDDDFDGAGIVRLDLRSDYEEKTPIALLMELISKYAFDLLGVDTLITKIPIYAVERQEAAAAVGFEKSDSLLKGSDGRLYDGYWILRR